MFAPLYRRLLSRMPQWQNVTALATLLIIVVIVIIPLTLITASLLQEGSSLYQRFQSGEISFSQYLLNIRHALPEWADSLLNRFELTSLAAVETKLSTAFTNGGQYLASEVLNVGQTGVSFILSLFVMLYLLFYLLRDGDELLRYAQEAVPLPLDQQSLLFTQFTETVRATVKGDLLVAVIQGALGGLIFWFLSVGAPVLWAVVMAVLSLMPVFGSALIWLPVAIYLLLTGSVTQGIALLVYGTLVMTLIVDNFLRPVLVGKDIKMPSYVVLISTLGGIGIFGVNGFVIGPVIAAMFLATWGIARTSQKALSVP